MRCRDCAQVYDQHLDYLVLAPSLFSLAPSLSTPLPSASSSSTSTAVVPSAGAGDARTTYEKLNDPRAAEADIEDITDRVARGLFSVVVTMGASSSRSPLLCPLPLSHSLVSSELGAPH